MQVTTITVKRDTGVHVDFADGRECDFGLVELRLNCPCAGCRVDRERHEAPWPKSHSPRPLRIVDAQLVGAWGVSLVWNDDHAAGIYSWELLRNWCEAGRPRDCPDSGPPGSDP